MQVDPAPPPGAAALELDGGGLGGGELEDGGALDVDGGALEVGGVEKPVLIENVGAGVLLDAFVVGGGGGT